LLERHGEPASVHSRVLSKHAVLSLSQIAK
jgi:hypothetical protein